MPSIRSDLQVSAMSRQPLQAFDRAATPEPYLDWKQKPSYCLSGVHPFADLQSTMRLRTCYPKLPAMPIISFMPLRHVDLVRKLAPVTVRCVASGTVASCRAPRRTADSPLQSDTTQTLRLAVLIVICDPCELVSMLPDRVTDSCRSRPAARPFGA